MGDGETTPKDQRLGRMMAAVVKAAAAVAAGQLTRLPMSCLRLVSTVSRTSANGSAADSATWLMTSTRTVSASVAPLPLPRRPGQLSGGQPHHDAKRHRGHHGDRWPAALRYPGGPGPPSGSGS
jgi:hypothetical protein